MDRIRNFASFLFRPNVPPGPRFPARQPLGQTGIKRKATGDPRPRAKLRRLSDIRAEERYVEEDSDDADFYGGHARQAFLRDQSRSFDAGTPQYMDQGRTFLERAGMKGDRYERVKTGSVGNLRLVGVPMEEAKRIEDDVNHLRVSQKAKKEIIEGIAQKLKDTSPKVAARPPSAAYDVALEDLEKAVHTKPTARGGSDGQESTWDSAPNKRARQILATAKDKAAAAAAIKEDMRNFASQEEPEYALRDIEIRDGLWQVMDKMEKFARKHFDFEFSNTPANRRTLTNVAFPSLKPESVKVIGCVASGGPSGQDGWRDLFFDKQKRRALVCAVIGNVITEQVYQHSFFGGSREDEDAIKKIQQKHKDEDGFDRNRLYAEYVSKTLKFRGGKSSTLSLPPEFDAHVRGIVAGILLHLGPILNLSRSTTKRDASYISSLYGMIAQAGFLSLFMRLDPHTVYYCTPVFKEDTFSRKFMECFNKRNMEATHPRERTNWPANTPQAEINRAKGDDPLTQITIMDGITAYRLGGWETRDSTPWTVQHAKEMKGRGVRSRILTHGWVFCRWGKARRFKEGRSADDAKMHGTQWKGGFVGFRDVEGVPRLERASSRRSNGS